MVLDRIGKHGLLDGVILRSPFNHGMVSRLRFDETTRLRPINPDGKLAAPSTWSHQHRGSMVGYWFASTLVIGYLYLY
jgi:hypothetical protein